MPVVNTLHSFILGESVSEGTDKYNSDINVLITNITYDILKESPGLVADVANNTIDRAVLETAIIKDIDKHKYHYGLSREELIGRVFNYMFGYGALQPYIDDESISDIDGTKYNEFVIKREGVREVIPVNLGNEEIFDIYCKLIAVRNGGILNENDSHCRVTDEKNRLRINVSVRPRNISGPSISIRKHRKESLSLAGLAHLGMFDEEVLKFLKKLALTDATILICGKGAAGKTTFMRAMVNIFPVMERVLIVESDAEIYPDKPYCIEQRVKKQNEGGRQITLRDLVRDGLTMSLDCYCIGEIVGDEAWEYIKASFTGHRSIATTHAESATDAFGRLLTLSKGANIGESERTIKEMMARSIDVIFHLKNFKVVEVLEVVGYDAENDLFEYNRLFGYEVIHEDVNGFITGGYVRYGEAGSRLKEKFRRRGQV